MIPFPVNLNIEERSCLVVGGGAVAERKVRLLLEVGAHITVVSPALTTALAQWAATSKIVHVPRIFQTDDLQGRFLVFTTTDQREVNQTVVDSAKALGVLINVADDPASCDFTLPASLIRGDLLITVSSGGSSPAAAKALIQELADEYGPEYGVYIEMVGKIRNTLKSSGTSIQRRQEIWREFKWFDENILNLIRQGSLKEAEDRISDAINGTGTQP